MQAQRRLYEDTVRALSDPATTTVFLVSWPESSALAEAERTRQELETLGLKNQRLVLNGVFRAQAKEDAIAAAREARGREAVREMPRGLSCLRRVEVPLVAHALIGVAALRELAGERPSGMHRRDLRLPSQPLPAPLAALIPELVRDGKGVIMTMGKGGVGKTTVAAALALALARRGLAVHLTTTDPAAHVEMAIRSPFPGLRVSRIDPMVETRAYQQEVMAESGKGLDAPGRALLEEDLRSPCTEEIAVFRALARAVEEGEEEFVVIDTAPTGHTLLLLDAANAYHRDVARNLSYVPESVRRLMPRLRDAARTRILLVTVPEATPVHEAARLQEDLRRAGIVPYAWVVNQSLLASGTRDPLLEERGTLELRYLNEVRDHYAERVALIPWQAQPPAGPERLRELMEASPAVAGGAER